MVVAFSFADRGNADASVDDADEVEDRIVDGFLTVPEEVNDGNETAFGRLVFANDEIVDRDAVVEDVRDAL